MAGGGDYAALSREQINEKLKYIEKQIDKKEKLIQSATTSLIRYRDYHAELSAVIVTPKRKRRKNKER